MFWSFLTVIIMIVLMDLISHRLAVPRVRSYGLSLLCVAMVQPVSFLFFTGGEPDFWQLILVTGVGLMLWFVYLNFAQALNSSLRIRMLLEMGTMKHPISVRELEEKYNDQALIQLRLARLVAGGQIERRGGRYYLHSNKLVQIARFFSLLKILIIGKASQFD